MHKLIKLEKDYSVGFASSGREFLNPEYIFLPIKSNYKLLVKKDEEVLKGQIVMENNLNKVLSTVSGKVIGLKEMNCDGKTQKCLVIANDYKEKEKNTGKVKDITKDKEAIISKLYEFYFKYIASILESKKINNLIISTFDDEPYIFNSYFIAGKYYKEILEMSDILVEAFNINRCSIVFKSDNALNIEKYLSKIGTYPNINLNFVEDKYLLSKSFFLLEYLNLDEIDSFVIDVKTLYEMYLAIKYNKFCFENYITISGPAFLKGCVVKTKIGSQMEDVITSLGKKIPSDAKYILNGVMTGNECDISKVVVTHNTLGVNPIILSEEKEKACINCGLCAKICPVKVNPKKVMNKRQISEKCIDCGLCSYICPSYINLRKFLRGEHE